MKWPLIIRRVVGHSMEPALSPGQIVLATPLLTTEKSDVVVAKVDGRNVIKRVSEVSPSRVSLSGDNSDHSRMYGEVDKKAILGRVLGVK